MQICFILHVCTQLWVDISRSFLQVAETTWYANLVEGGVDAIWVPKKWKWSVQYLVSELMHLELVMSARLCQNTSLCCFWNTRLIKIKTKCPWNDTNLVTMEPTFLSSIIALLCNSWNFGLVQTENSYVHLCEANHLKITDNVVELCTHFWNLFILVFGVVEASSQNDQIHNLPYERRIMRPQHADLIDQYHNFKRVKYDCVVLYIKKKKSWFWGNKLYEYFYEEMYL